MHEVFSGLPVLDESVLENEEDALEQKKRKLLDGWMNGILSDADYQLANKRIENELSVLQQRQLERERNLDCSDRTSQIMKIMQCAFSNANLQSSEILDELVRKFIEKIVIRRADSNGTDDQKPSYVMEIWLYESENPVNLDFSPRLRTGKCALTKRLLITEFIYRTKMPGSMRKRTRSLTIRAYLIAT